MAGKRFIKKVFSFVCPDLASVTENSKIVLTHLGSVQSTKPSKIILDSTTSFFRICPLFSTASLANNLLH